LLIDSSHKRWALSTAAIAVVLGALYGWLSSRTPGGLTGGSSVGLWYGIAGSALMVYAGLLAAHRRVPTWAWIGPRKLWLKGHIWLGLLSVPLILCHAGFHWGGALERVLWVVFGLTILTGVFGLLLQQFLPRAITLRVQREAPYEQIPHLCRMMRQKGDALINEVWSINAPESQASIMMSQIGIGAKVQLQEFYERQVRQFLAERYQRSSALANRMQAEAAFDRLRSLPGLVEVKEQVSQLASLCEERRQLAEQERLHHWLHAWLLFHIPLSVALLVLAVAHVVAALYY
jgi:hypothetical protein